MAPCIIVSMSSDAATLCRELAARITALVLDHPVRLGIDGVDAAGKTTLADTLGAVLTDLGRPVVRASIDGFHRPRAERYRLGRQSPEGYYRDSFQNDAVVACLLAPLGPRGSRQIHRAVFDYRSDRAVHSPEELVPVDAVLVFDGIFLHRRELRVYWDATIYLDVPFATTVMRAAARDGWPAAVDDPANHRYVAGQQRYLNECRPRDLASIVVDNTDFTTPRIVAVRPPLSTS